ncbi:hypothetical protein [Croceicoccus sediminis]|uniref:hypothetical protein n=1 Tax=Croceicoccus sediminis TaxID=2571150 RepID=UPI001181C962|nr:hypothetical protein [Croceicoccus sediminis]
MWFLIPLIIGLVLVAAFSGGLALCLHLLRPGLAKRTRILIAGGLAGFLPMSIAFGGFFSQSADLLRDGGSEFALGLTALVVFQFVLWAVFTLPAAWYVTEKLDGDDAPAIGADEETLAIEG